MSVRIWFLEFKRETNLDYGVCEWHIIDISWREVLVSLRLTCLVCLRDLFPQPVLDPGPLRELPERIHQLRTEDYQMSSRGVGHLVCSQLSTPYRVRRTSVSELEG